LPSPGLLVFILFVDLAPEVGRVPEDQVDVRVEQVRDPEEDLLLDAVGFLEQEVQGAVELLELPVGGLRQVDLLLEPVLVAGQLGAGCLQPVGGQRQQQTVMGHSAAPRRHPGSQRFADAELFPEPLGDVDRAVAACLLDLDLTDPPALPLGQLRLLAHPEDAGCQPLQDCLVELVYSTEIMNDFGFWPLAVAVVDRLGELVVLDFRTILVLPLGHPQVHACRLAIEMASCQRIIHKSCIYVSGVWRGSAVEISRS